MAVTIDGAGEINGVTLPTTGFGKVLQVVSATTSTMVSSSTETLADTGLTATITPLLATSQILAIFSNNGGQKAVGHINNGITVYLYRDAVSLLKVTQGAGYSNSNSTESPASISGTYLDSPATTSAVTYKTMFANNYASNLVYLQLSNVNSTITLMEVAA